MLKKVSNNIISLLKYFEINRVDNKIFDNFISNLIPVEISGLVTADEIEHLPIDRKLLNDLEDALDELEDYFIEDIDIDYINLKLNDLN